MTRNAIIRIFALIVLWCLLTAASLSHAVQLDERGCASYAVWAHDVLWAREVGADKDKVRVSLVEISEAPGGEPVQLILRAFDELWATSIPRQQVLQMIYRDCVQRRGRYGEGT